MLLAADASTSVAWIGAIALILSALIAAVATSIASRNRTTIRDTTADIAESTSRVVNLEDVFEDIQAERNRARALAEKETQRADAAEERADRAQRRAEELEVRVRLLEVQAELYRVQHPGEAE